jgi:flagellar hook assembly protein FlgD
MRIRIYTIAGRKIREIVVPQHALQVGFNRVPWDGRDEVGDDIANGYYLYQVQVSSGGVVNTAIEKLVKVR